MEVHRQDMKEGGGWIEREKEESVIRRMPKQVGVDLMKVGTAFFWFRRASISRAEV